MKKFIKIKIINLNDIVLRFKINNGYSELNVLIIDGVMFTRITLNENAIVHKIANDLKSKFNVNKLSGCNIEMVQFAINKYSTLTGTTK